MHNLNPKNVIPLHRGARPGGAGRVPMSTGVGPVAQALVASARWQKARDQASAALLGGQRRVVVTGAAGTGKTVLLEHVARVLRAAGWTVVVQLADAAPSLPDADGPDADGPVALLVDEADRLSRDQLQALLRATDGPLVLAGLDGLAARVPDAVRIGLVKLDQEECRDYIAKWLAQSGRTPANLDTAAMRRIVVLSGGVPRLLASLLSTSTWLADTADAPVILLEHVEEAAELRACFTLEDGAEEGDAVAAAPAVARRSRLVVPAMAAMLVAGIGGLAASILYPAETDRVITPAVAMLAGLREEVGGWQSGAGPVAAPMAGLARAPEPVAEPPASAVASVAAVPPVETGPSEPLSTPLPQPSLAAASETPVEISEPQLEPASQAASPAAAEPEPVAVAVNSAPVQAISVVPTAPVVAPVRAMPGATVDLLLRRGREMVGIGDISAARLLFSRVAEAGNAEAMVALGQTYDPAALGVTGALMQPDPAEAARWYGQAARNGSEEAGTLLARLKQDGKH